MNMATPKNQISEELRTFIKDKIQTVLRLEVLLLLHNQQSRSFTAAEIASELGCETEPTHEQLRALEHGFRIRTVETLHESVEVDTPEDLDRVRRHIAVGTSA